MAAYQTEFKRSAEKDLLRIATADLVRLRAAIRALAETPRPTGALKLAGADDAYRIRVGNYRIIFRINDEDKRVSIERVRHRREVYRD